MTKEHPSDYGFPKTLECPLCLIKRRTALYTDQHRNKYSIAYCLNCDIIIFKPQHQKPRYLFPPQRDITNTETIDLIKDSIK